MIDTGHPRDIYIPITGLQHKDENALYDTLSNVIPLEYGFTLEKGEYDTALHLFCAEGVSVRKITDQMQARINPTEAITTVGALKRPSLKQRDWDHEGIADEFRLQLLHALVETANDLAVNATGNERYSVSTDISFSYSRMVTRETEHGIVTRTATNRPLYAFIRLPDSDHPYREAILDKLEEIITTRSNETGQTLQQLGYTLERTGANEIKISNPNKGISFSEIRPLIFHIRNEEKAEKSGGMPGSIFQPDTALHTASEGERGRLWTIGQAIFPGLFK